MPPQPATTNPLAGHPVMQLLDVAMSSIVGDYDDADFVPEWQWVKQMASHEHVGVKDDSAYEYTLNLPWFSIRPRHCCNLYSLPLNRPE